jgi:hypothetical protein
MVLEWLAAHDDLKMNGTITAVVTASFALK